MTKVNVLWQKWIVIHSAPSGNFPWCIETVLVNTRAVFLFFGKVGNYEEVFIKIPMGQSSQRRNPSIKGTAGLLAETGIPGCVPEGEVLPQLYPGFSLSGPGTVCSRKKVLLSGGSLCRLQQPGSCAELDGRGITENPESSSLFLRLCIIFPFRSGRQPLTERVLSGWFASRSRFHSWNHIWVIKWLCQRWRWKQWSGCSKMKKGVCYKLSVIRKTPPFQRTEELLMGWDQPLIRVCPQLVSAEIAAASIPSVKNIHSEERK